MQSRKKKGLQADATYDCFIPGVKRKIVEGSKAFFEKSWYIKG